MRWWRVPRESPFRPAVPPLMLLLAPALVLAAAALPRNDSLWSMWAPRVQMCCRGRTSWPQGGDAVLLAQHGLGSADGSNVHYCDWVGESLMFRGAAQTSRMYRLS